MWFGTQELSVSVVKTSENAFSQNKLYGRFIFSVCRVKAAEHKSFGLGNSCLILAQLIAPCVGGFY